MTEAESFLEYLKFERNYSMDTIKAYSTDLEQFSDFAGIEEGTLENADSSLIREWAISLMGSGYSSTSINRKLSSLRSFYKYLLKHGKIEVDPMIKVGGPKNKKQLPVFIKEKEMDELLDKVDFGEGFLGRRDHLIIEMFYETGIRLAELIGLDNQDVDFHASVIKVTGKRSKQRVIPFYEELKAAMQEYIETRTKETVKTCDAFFVRENGNRITRGEVSAVVKKSLSKVSTVKKKSPHVLRHTFATTMLNHHAELGAIKELLGHESLATTEIYTHTTFEELKEAYNNAHPRA